MDLNALVRLIYAKHELMLGVSITLLLIVTVLMLVRSVMEDRQAEKKSDKSGDLDAKTLNTAIEGAMKKVLADKGIQGAIAGAAGASVAGGGAAGPEATELKKSLSEKEAKIAALMTDIEALKVAADKVQPTADGGVAHGVDIGALQAKLAELQAKLAEYEIIEDDIADLSMYKEENKKLKAELTTLKAAVETAQTQVHAASVSVEAAPHVEDPVQVAQAAVTSPAPQEKFELDKSDSVMNEFAQAISGESSTAAQPETSFESQLVVASDSPLADPQAAIDAIMSQSQAEEQAVAEKAPSEENLEVTQALPELPVETAAATPGVLDEALDTNKLQAEVSKLAAELESMALEAAGDSSVLDESLDTDKLMQELAGSEEPTKPATPPQTLESSLASPRESAVVSAKPEVVESGAKPRPPSAPAEDDLLAEFKDVDFQNSKTTKGS